MLNLRHNFSSKVITKIDAIDSKHQRNHRYRQIDPNGFIDSRASVVRRQMALCEKTTKTVEYRENSKDFKFTFTDSRLDYSHLEQLGSGGGKNGITCRISIKMQMMLFISSVFSVNRLQEPHSAPGSAGVLYCQFNWWPIIHVKVEDRQILG